MRPTICIPAAHIVGIIVRPIITIGKSGQGARRADSLFPTPGEQDATTAPTDCPYVRHGLTRLSPELESQNGKTRNYPELPGVLLYIDSHRRVCRPGLRPRHNDHEGL